MTTDLSKVTIHMVASLDSRIARHDDSISWLLSADNYEEGIAEENTDEFIRAIDCFVMGARTYELALKLGWPYGEVPSVVLTHRELPADRENIEFYAGDLYTLVNNRLKANYKNIWLVGGARLVRDFIRLKLADEIIISIMPVILGEGRPFFEQPVKEQALHLKKVTAYKNGMVELCYEIKK